MLTGLHDNVEIISHVMMNLLRLQVTMKGVYSLNLEQPAARTRTKKSVSNKSSEIQMHGQVLFSIHRKFKCMHIYVYLCSRI